MKKRFPDAVNGDRHLGKELDVYIPSIKTAIEYDGEYWHQNVRRDEEKNQICREHGIQLFRIRERACWFFSDMPLRQIGTLNGDSGALTSAIKELLDLIDEHLERNLLTPKCSLFCDYDIDVERDKREIQKQYYRVLREHSFAKAFPDIAQEWDYTKMRG